MSRKIYFTFIFCFLHATPTELLVSKPAQLIGLCWYWQTPKAEPLLAHILPGKGRGRNAPETIPIVLTSGTFLNAEHTGESITNVLLFNQHDSAQEILPCYTLNGDQKEYVTSLRLVIRNKEGFVAKAPKKQKIADIFGASNDIQEILSRMFEIELYGIARSLISGLLTHPDFRNYLQRYKLVSAMTNGFAGNNDLKDIQPDELRKYARNLNEELDKEFKDIADACKTNPDPEIGPLLKQVREDLEEYKAWHDGGVQKIASSLEYDMKNDIAVIYGTLSKLLSAFAGPENSVFPNCVRLARCYDPVAGFRFRKFLDVPKGYEADQGYKKHVKYPDLIAKLVTWKNETPLKQIQHADLRSSLDTCIERIQTNIFNILDPTGSWSPEESESQYQEIVDNAERLEAAITNYPLNILKWGRRAQDATFTFEDLGAVVAAQRSINEKIRRLKALEFTAIDECLQRLKDSIKALCDKVDLSGAQTVILTQGALPLLDSDFQGMVERVIINQIAPSDLVFLKSCQGERYSSPVWFQVSLSIGSGTGLYILETLLQDCELPELRTMRLKSLFEFNLEAIFDKVESHMFPLERIHLLTRIRECLGTKAGLNTAQISTLSHKTVNKLTLAINQGLMDGDGYNGVNRVLRSQVDRSEYSSFTAIFRKYIDGFSEREFEGHAFNDYCWRKKHDLLTDEEKLEEKRKQEELERQKATPEAKRQEAINNLAQPRIDERLRQLNDAPDLRDDIDIDGETYRYEKIVAEERRRAELELFGEIPQEGQVPLALEAKAPLNPQSSQAPAVGSSTFVQKCLSWLHWIFVQPWISIWGWCFGARTDQ